MLLNDPKNELVEFLIENNMNYREVADLIGTNRAYIYRIPTGEVVKKSFITMYEKLGYDIKIEYVKRDESNNG